jgi:DNA-binding HxlR family transcriptional regulator
MPKRYGQACPVAQSLEFLGERWTLLIVRDLLPGPRRFQDLQTSLTGIAPNVLSDRLKTMEEHGLVERRFYTDHPPRAEYALTERGQGLGLVVGALAQWGSRHLHPDTALVHDTCGSPIDMGYFCKACGGRVRGAEVTLGTRQPRADASATSRSPAPPPARSGSARAPSRSRPARSTKPRSTPQIGQTGPRKPGQ